MSEKMAFLTVAKCLGTVVRHIRLMKRVRRGALARRVGMDLDRLAAIERGGIEINFSKLIDICAALRVVVECKFEDNSVYVWFRHDDGKDVLYSGDDIPF